MDLKDVFDGEVPNEAWLATARAQRLLDELPRRRALYRALMRACRGPVRPPFIDTLGPLLRALLEREIAFRRATEANDVEHAESTDYENLYCCALLLFEMGALENVLPLWRAKLTNMDTGMGLDTQCLVGAGLDATLAYLAGREDHDARAAHDHIVACAEEGELDELESWRAFRYQYYLGAAG